MADELQLFLKSLLSVKNEQEKTTETVALQYSDGSQTCFVDTLYHIVFQYHANLDGSLTSIADTICAWSSTLAVFPWIQTEPHKNNMTFMSCCSFCVSDKL